MSNNLEFGENIKEERGKRGRSRSIEQTSMRKGNEWLKNESKIIRNGMREHLLFFVKKGEKLGIR